MSRDGDPFYGAPCVVVVLAAPEGMDLMPDAYERAEKNRHQR